MTTNRNPARRDSRPATACEWRGRARNATSHRPREAQIPMVQNACQQKTCVAVLYD